MTSSQLKLRFIDLPMDQLQTDLLPLSSQTPTPTNHSPLNSINPPPPTSSNPKFGTTVSTNSHHTYPPTHLRFATILTLFFLSVWANYEASKGFDLTILNSPAHTLAARRFDLLLVSNGRAADMALKSSHFIENILYPHEESFPRKPVSHVTIRLADHNITDDVLVSRCDGRERVLSGKYRIEISPSVILRKDAKTTAVASALHRGMAYVWLWDGHGSVPQPIIDAMVEFLLVQYKLPSKHYESCSHLTSILTGLIKRCEERSNGFVARLNNAVREKWDEHTVIDAFRSPSEIMCLSHIISASEDGFLADDSGLNLELNHQAM